MATFWAFELFSYMEMAKMAEKNGIFNHSSHFDHSNHSSNFQLMDGSVVSLDDLKLHILDILAGRFDKYDLPGTAMIEDRVKKKVQEIVQNPEPYKTLLHLHGKYKRVHLDPYILLFTVEGEAIEFLAIEHHDKAYER